MDAKKTRVAIICGGRSGEHEVSLQSAKSVISAIDRGKFDVEVIGIRKDGSWYLMNEEKFLVNPDDPEIIALASSGDEIFISPAPGADCFRTRKGAIGIDVVFPVLHGTYGEDGTIQGMFDMIGVPYVGANYLGSAAAMDKDLSKRLFREAGLPVTKYLVFTEDEANRDYAKISRAVEKELSYPVFVKPANLGSSVGISKVTNKNELTEALKDAWQYDTKIIVEEGIKNCREIECAVLGNRLVEASELGEVKPNEKHGYYSYDAKYLDPNGAELIVGVKDINPEIKKKIQEIAKKAFKVLECEGMARADFFVQKDTNKIYLNELNTIPGFTKISMYPKLWGASGVQYTELITRLIELAMKRHKTRSKLKTDFKV